MWCAACGSQLVSGARFCTRCGTPATADQLPAVSVPQAPSPVPIPVPVRPRRLGSALIGGGAALVAVAVVAAILVGAGVVSVGMGARSDQTARIEGPGYATPQKAAEAYLAAMTSADVPAMITTFAIETYGEHADGARTVERLHAFTGATDPALPRAKLNDQLNAQWHLSRMITAVYHQYLTLSDPSFDGSTLAVGSTAGGQTFADVDALNTYVAAAFDGTAFAGISSAKLIDWESAYPQLAGVFNTEQNKKNRDIDAQQYGADEEAFQVADLQTQHGEYLLFLQLNRYGDRWWVGSFSGNLSSLVGVDASTGGLISPVDVK